MGYLYGVRVDDGCLDDGRLVEPVEGFIGFVHGEDRDEYKDAVFTQAEESSEAKDAENEVVSCKYFTTSIYDLDHTVRKDLSDIDSFLVVMCLSGSGTLTDSEPAFDEEGHRGPTKGHRTTLHQGETVLIPASSIGVTFTPAEGGMKLLTSYIK